MSTKLPQQTGLVTFIIKVDGKKVSALYPVISIVVDKTINKIPSAKITLTDGVPAQESFSIINSNDFKLGASIEILAGYHNKEEKIFEGIIVKQEVRAKNERTPLLIVACRDIVYRATLVPKNRSFEHVKDSDVFQEILGNYKGLTKKIASTTIKHEKLLQQEMTDWDFLNVRAEANGQVITVDDSTIHVEAPNLKQSPQLSLTYGQNMYAFEMEMDVRDQWQGAEGNVWSPNEQKSQLLKATEPGELSFGDTKYNALASANQQESRTFYHGGELEEREIETLAESLLKQSRLSKIRGKIKIQGLAAIKLNQVIEIKGKTNHFKGKAYVSGIRHEISEGNWTTELKLGHYNQRYMRQYDDIIGLPAAGMLAPVHGLQIGTVKKLEKDPQKTYRIFVYLPMIHKNDEGIWCRIASFYASKGVGAFFMPEINDEVVVGFINDDPRFPVVVGSLYSKKHNTPVEASDENLQKVFVTKSKLELIFEDKDKEITLKTPGSRSISISDKANTIEMIDDQTNKIRLGEKGIELESTKDITIKAQGAIQLSAGKNTDLKADNKMNIEGGNVQVNAKMKTALVGGTSAELKSKATTIVKGEIVMIN